MIHLFGESFTFCQGCNPSEEYYEKTYDGTQKTWVQFTANHLNDRFKNHGMPGVGNQKIIDKIIEKLSSINDGDVVIIGRADDSRFCVPLTLKEYDFNGFSDVLVGMLLDRTDSFKRWNDSYYNAVVDYTKYVLIPNETPIIQRWDSIYNSFVDYFNKRNIKVILWRVDEQLRCDKTGGAKYPIISDEEPKIFDSHWSWNGHYKFFKQYMEPLL